MKTKKSIIALCLLLCVAGAGWWLRARSVSQPLPPSTVTTVIKIPFGDDAGQVPKMNRSIRGWTPHSPMRGLMPADVNQSGDISVLNDRRLLTFNAAGKLVQQFDCPWASQFSYPRKSEIYLARARLRYGLNQTLWLSDWPFYRLYKISLDGPVAAAQQSVAEIPVLPPPVAYPARRDDPTVITGELAGLFVAANGDVFILGHRGVMRRFSVEGSFIADYDLPRGQYFSAIATRDGSVYSIFGPVRNAAKQKVGLQLNHWPQPEQHTSRIIDPGGRFIKQQVSSDEIWLMGADGENNLYFQYMSPGQASRDSRIWENGPMAIAKVGSDGQMKKIFDVYEYYKDEMERARQQADSKRKRRGPVGIGDLIHVAANGDLYLEVANATHYRIDKISFPGQ